MEVHLPCVGWFCGCLLYPNQWGGASFRINLPRCTRIWQDDRLPTARFTAPGNRDAQHHPVTDLGWTTCLISPDVPLCHFLHLSSGWDQVGSVSSVRSVITWLCRVPTGRHLLWRKLGQQPHHGQCALAWGGGALCQRAGGSDPRLRNCVWARTF
jgi:hypothetical protein